MPSDAEHDVFLCHNSRDKPAVKKIAHQLRERGLRPWLDEWELRPGLPWQRALEQEIRRIGAAAVFVGENGEGPWQTLELEGFLRQFVKRSCPVIPVILPGCGSAPELPVFLEGMMWVDFRKQEPDPLEQLIWGITGHRQDDVATEPTPTYADDSSRALGDALDSAYRTHEELTAAGKDATGAQEEILELRRRIREGGRLKAGDFLVDGRFRLLEPLGRGGFATVFKAYDRRHRSLVAVKVLHGQYVEDRTRRERFFRGARKMAELQHQGIVRVIEPRIEEGGYCFFVMEYVAGVDLRKAVLEGQLVGEAGMEVIRKVADALGFAHERGVIHRDVKPANILLSTAGEPKLTDFDLVRAADTTGGTRTGSVLGTFLYMAPEALERSKEADVPAEVYSLAMTAAFVLHGQEIPSTVLRDPESFFEGLECSDQIREALAKATEWDPAQRFVSVGDFAVALVEDREQEAEVVQPSTGVPIPSARPETEPGHELVEPTTGTRFLWIPGGRFEMGDSASPHEDEKPAHRVRVSPFWLGETPVTNRQYGVFLEKTGASEPKYWSDSSFSDPEQPVVGVSWHDATKYSEWLSQMLGLEVKLPSEAQWEFAARGTDGRKYSWGNEEPDSSRACFGGNKLDGVGAHPTGKGPFGTLDQAGSVWEWCLDVWSEDEYRKRAGSEPTDPVIKEGGDKSRVLRGGGWDYPAEFLRAAYPLQVSC